MRSSPRSDDGLRATSPCRPTLPTFPARDATPRSRDLITLRRTRRDNPPAAVDRALTGPGPAATLRPSPIHRCASAKREADEADLPAAPDAPQARPRVSQADEDAGGSRGAEPAAREGPQAGGRHHSVE